MSMHNWVSNVHVFVDPDGSGLRRHRANRYHWLLVGKPSLAALQRVVEILVLQAHIMEGRRPLSWWSCSNQRVEKR